MTARERFSGRAALGAIGSPPTARHVMGTFLRARVEAGDDSAAAAAREALFRRIQGLEEALSFHREDSDVSRINRAAGLRPVPVRAETFRAIELALNYAERTEGAFDPTFRSRGGGLFLDIALDPGPRTVFLRRTGMSLDLGGIGKGFALDSALELILSEFPVSAAVVDFGGQWLFWSGPGGSLRETVAIEDPRNPGRVLSSLEIACSCSVSTSSQAQRPGHLLDPRSGRPADGCLSATAVAPTGAEAEALSTALFVLGRDRAEGILRRFPGARAVLH